MKKLKVIPLPTGKLNVIRPSPNMKGTLMSGPGTEDLGCGKCGEILVKGLGGQCYGMIFQCPACRNYNQA